MALQRQWLVDDGSAGTRLDAFLVRAGAAPSAAAARRAIAAGLIRVDGRAAKKGQSVLAGQTVAWTAAVGEAAASNPSRELHVLYEDEHVVAVDKPSGIPSHSLRPGDKDTVAGALASRFPDCATASPDAREGGLGHRLDRGTSGVLLAARHRAAWEKLRAALSGPECEKIYVAEVQGRPRVPAAQTGDAYVIEGEGPNHYVVCASIGRKGRRGSSVKVGGGRHPLAARTSLSVREWRPSTTLIEARLSKGRAHQVRAHLAYLGCPVVGDSTYGARHDDHPLRPAPWAGWELHLHAESVSLPHPMTGAPLRIVAPLPPWARPQTVSR